MLSARFVSVYVFEGARREMETSRHLSLLLPIRNGLNCFSFFFFRFSLCFRLLSFRGLFENRNESPEWRDWYPLREQGCQVNLCGISVQLSRESFGNYAGFAENSREDSKIKRWMVIDRVRKYAAAKGT